MISFFSIFSTKLWNLIDAYFSRESWFQIIAEPLNIYRSHVGS